MNSKLRLRYVQLQNRYGSFMPFVFGLVCMIFIMYGGLLFYMWVEGWNFSDSLYMVVLTLATVGYQEVHPLSDLGRIGTMVLIVLGVGTFMFMVGALSQLMVEGKLHKVLGRRRVKKHIDRLEGHFIICGYGRIGHVVSQEIKAEGYPVVIIEKNQELAEELEAKGELFLMGDATDDDLLLAAGLKKAKGVIAALENDAANVFVTLTARQLNPTTYIVARTSSENHIARLERAGANRVVMPHKIGGLRMAQSVLRPTVTSFMEVTAQGNVDMQMEELVIGEYSEIVGKTIIDAEIRPRFNAIIIGILQADAPEMLFNPGGDYVFQPDDTILVVGQMDKLKELREYI